MRFMTEEQSHKLKTIMFSQKIALKDLPGLIGGSRNHWMAIINGTGDPRESEIVALANLLKLTRVQVMDFFFSGIGA
jgi:hypothetical protein